MKTRPTLRATAVALAVPVFVALGPASPALAVYRDDGDSPGDGISVYEAIGLYAGIPIALFALCALLVYGGSLVRGPRYRPDLGWWASPVWFEGPPQGVAAVTALPTDVTTTEGGGASARW